jgi:putative redox protein
MVTIALTYRGELRCEAVHGPSGTHLLTDAPVDNQGRGEAFSPTDLVATALASCMMTIMGIVARRDAIAIAGLRCQAEKHMTASPPRRIARLVLRFAMPAALDAGQREALERAARTCPVALSLHPEVTVEIAFAYPD